MNQISLVYILLLYPLIYVLRVRIACRHSEGLRDGRPGFDLSLLHRVQTGSEADTA
jgi:hypothetical protein